MASAIIHMAVAKRVNDVLNLDDNPFLLGSIAPDIAKHIGKPKELSHFVTKLGTDIPDIKYFCRKYKKYLHNPYELGYLVHLLTDKLWGEEFLPNFLDDNFIIDKSGRKVDLPNDEVVRILYNDYSNLNVSLIDYYHMDLSLFYQPFPLPVNHIEEIDDKYFPSIIKKMADLAVLSADYSYILNIERITHFVEFATIYVLDEIKKIDL